MNEELRSEDVELIQDVFDGMFQQPEYTSVLEDAGIADPTPPVPLTSNLLLLLAIGLALGFHFSKRTFSSSESNR
jgi:hypothetical protein